MADQRNGGIAWTDETWNPVAGCSRVSQGCGHCYAERVAARFSGPGLAFEGLARNTQDGPRWTGNVLFRREALGWPLRQRRPRTCFVGSMTDLFQPKLDADIVLAIYGVMAALPRWTFQILTKRPERALEILIDGSSRAAHAAARRLLPTDEERVLLERESGRHEQRAWPPQNVWLGVSVEDQPSAEKRLPYLVATPAALRFVSAEPLLGPVSLVRWLVPERSPQLSTMAAGGVRWVIVGGESGPWARPMHPDWARDLHRQCSSVGTAFFFKQWGAWSPVVTEVPNMTTVPCSIHGPQQMGPSRNADAGRTLDGVLYSEIPERP